MGLRPVNGFRFPSFRWFLLATNSRLSRMVEEKTSRIPKWLKGVLWTGLVLGVAYFGFYGYSWMKRLQAENAFRSAGFPVAPSEIKQEGPSGEENGVQLVMALSEELFEHLCGQEGIYPGSTVDSQRLSSGFYGVLEIDDDVLFDFGQKPEVQILLKGFHLVTYSTDWYFS